MGFCNKGMEALVNDLFPDEPPYVPSPDVPSPKGRGTALFLGAATAAFAALFLAAWWMGAI